MLSLWERNNRVRFISLFDTFYFQQEKPSLSAIRVLFFFNFINYQLHRLRRLCNFRIDINNLRRFFLSKRWLEKKIYKMENKQMYLEEITVE